MKGRDHLILAAAVLCGFLNLAASEESPAFDSAVYLQEMKAHPVLRQDSKLDLGNENCPVMTKKSKRGKDFEFHNIVYRVCCRKCVKRLKTDAELFLLSQDDSETLKQTVRSGIGK